MQARVQIPVPSHTSLGSHLHPVPIPSLGSRHCLIQGTASRGCHCPPGGSHCHGAGRYRRGWPVPLPAAATWLELPEPWSQCCLFSIINE